MNRHKTSFLDKLRYGKQLGYETLFKTQPKMATGKPGIIIAEMGLPEDYDFQFYNHFMRHVFGYVLPPFVEPMVMADRGKGLLDPENPLAREAFTPGQLIDANGSFTNSAGIPYVECECEWKPPANKKNEWDHGYFLYKGDGPSGSPDVCDKVGAKIAGWYYGRLLPEKKVPWRSQLRKVYEDAVVRLKEKYPNAEFRNGRYMYPDTVHKTVGEHLDAGCETIIYQNINCPLYTDFEDYGYCLPLVYEAVSGRATVIMADQLGNQSGMREAYFQILRDQLSGIHNGASVFVVLSRHGHPFKKETQDALAHLYCDPLEKGVLDILGERGGKWDVAWTFDEYADSYWDPKNTKLDTTDAYKRAIEEGWDYALELPTEFPAENTDLMIFHAMKKFSVFKEYNMHQPVAYPNWDKPLVRTFREGNTTGIYSGCPVGPYRCFVVEALVDSLESVLSHS